MGESDRYIDYRSRKFSLGSDGNSLMMLVSINAVIFIILSFINVFHYMLQLSDGAFESNVLPWFTMPAKLSSLAERPWTIISYMFSHVGLIVTLTNMIWLWAFGSILQTMAGNKKLIPVYLYGGIAGAVAFIVASYLVPSLKPSLEFSYLLGSNPATMAIAVAATTLAPDYRFFRMLNGGIPIWVLTLLYILIDFAGISNAGAAHNIAHLAGGFIGFMFVFSLRKGRDWSLWMNNLYDRFMNLFNPHKKVTPVKRIREKVFYKTGTQKPFVKRAHVTQQRIDEILDKINQKGYHLLTEEEKNILKRASETDL